MSAPAEVSVILPTFNPHRGRLGRTLAGLREQTLPSDRWELVIVDNNSPPANRVRPDDVAWHPAGRVVFEPRPGLTPARRAGIAATAAPLMVFVDDDNVLAPDYLEAAGRIAARHAAFGAYGGIAAPGWEQPPPAWTAEFHCYLALRDLGPEPLHAGGGAFGPEFTPNGAGMVVRRAVAEAWARELERCPERATLDRAAGALGAHGDLDLAWASFALGLEVAYVPKLRLEHLIPPQRLTRDYLARLLYGMAYSGQFFVAARSGNPPPVAPPLLPLRKLKRFLLTGAALRPAAYVWWRHYCGILDAQRVWHRSADRNASPSAA
jgi:glycosyltransferase involved in cell wall biosynthesis